MLTQKFNEETSNLSGFTPRSPNLWSEVYNDQESHLLLAKEGTRTLGYLIVALHKYSTARVATISELCAWERTQQTTEALLFNAEFCAKKMGADALVSWEHNNKQISGTLRSFGFLNVGRSVFSVGVTSVDFIKKTLESNEKAVSSSSKKNAKNIVVDLGKKYFPSYSEKFVTRINPDGSVSVEEGKPIEKPYAYVQTDLVTFNEVILRLQNPLTAVLSRRITVSPVWKTLQVVSILRQISNRVDWYLPLGDYF